MVLHRSNMLYQNVILKNKKYYFNIFINKKISNKLKISLQFKISRSLHSLLFFAHPINFFFLLFLLLFFNLLLQIDSDNYCPGSRPHPPLWLVVMTRAITHTPASRRVILVNSFFIVLFLINCIILFILIIAGQYACEMLHHAF
jgi:hypothetical protein